MDDVQRKIRCVLGRYFSGSDGYSLPWLDDLATAIASAIGKTDEKTEPDLPISPGEWRWVWIKRERADRIAHLEVVGDWNLDPIHEPMRLADVYGLSDDDAEANAKAIAALPKLIKAALNLAKYHESLGEPWVTDPLCVELKSALEGAGIEPV